MTDGVSGHLASMLLISLNQLFPKNSANLSKCAVSNVTLIKSKKPLLFFLLLLSLSSLFLSPFLFFVNLILELLGLNKRAFWRLFTQMTAKFLRLVFKKSARYILYKLRDLARLFTVPCFCVRSSRYSASYRYYYFFYGARPFWFSSVPRRRASKIMAVEEGGRGKRLFFFMFFASPQTVPAL